MNRRELLRAAAAFTALLACGAADGQKIERALIDTMLPDDLPLVDRYKLAVAVGFRSMEVRTVTSQAEAERINDAAQRAGLRIHSVLNQSHRGNPLSSPNPAEVEACVAGVGQALRQAELYGTDALLFVPARARADTTYEQAWKRSQA